MNVRNLLRFIKCSLVVTPALFVLCTQAIEKRTLETVQPGATNYMEVRNADSVVFSWDAPPWDPDTVQYYELFYKTIRDTTLTLLKSSIPPTAKPEIVVHRSEIPSTDSLFYMAVVYITGDGIISALHFSSDSITVPPGGWFLFWKPK